MKFTSAVFLGLAATSWAAPSPVDTQEAYVACYASDGVCSQLSHAIAVGSALLNSPFTESSEDSKPFEDYLGAALEDAKNGDGNALSKRSPLRRGWSFCRQRGDICMKTKRAAEAITTILGNGLEKRDPRGWSFCRQRGDICMKTKRSADALLLAARDVSSALSEEA